MRYKGGSVDQEEEDDEEGKEGMVEVSSRHQSVMSCASSRDRPSPSFSTLLTRPKAPDTELNRGGKKLTQEKSGKSGADSDEKQRNSNVEKLTRVKIREIAGKFEIGNYLELR